MASYTRLCEQRQTETDPGVEKIISNRSLQVSRGERSSVSVPTSFYRFAEKLVVVPEEAQWLIAWDMWIVTLLFVTTYYEPYAVAVLPEDPEWAFTLNHLLDLTFTIDMLLTFFIAYGEPLCGDAENSVWVKDLGRIARRYCKWPLSEGWKAGWFWVDLVTILPGWLDFVLPPSTSENCKALVLFRLLRLVRITKLVRLQHLLSKWHQRHGFPFYMVELGKFFFITTLTVHWMACAWIIVEGRISNGKLSYYTHQESWLSALIKAKGDSCAPSASQDPNCVYAISLYWATMTLTTVGYGDITAQNPVEYLVCTLGMLVVAYVWAYVVGKMVTLLESLDPEWQHFKVTMDTLQRCMDSRELPTDLQRRLRRYLHESRTTSLQVLQRQHLQEHVSQSLQREVALSSGIMENFTSRVFWAEDLQQDALLDLVRAFLPRSFGPGEILMLPRTLVCMRRGLAASKGFILSRGDIWGHTDILLVTDALIESTYPRTLSYVDILSLERCQLVEVCEKFPHVDRRLRRAQIRTAAFRAFIKTAARNITAKSDGSAKPAGRQSLVSSKSAATSFVTPGKSHLHMSGLAQTDETKLSDLKHMLQQCNERNDELEDLLNSVLEHRVDYQRSTHRV